MATVTGLTAARMQQIIDEQYANGAVDLDGHLKFTRNDGAVIDAGYVVGPQGEPAPPLPDRLSETGQQVFDWNLARNPGFYWSDYGALNIPIEDRLVGHVYYMGGSLEGRAVQIVMRPTVGTNLIQTFRRAYNAVDGSWSVWRTLNEDSGWMSSGVISASTGWTVSSYDIRVYNGIVQLRFVIFTRTGVALNGNAGDIGNTIFASISDSQFFPTRGTMQLYSANTGRISGGYVQTDGTMGISAVAAGLTDTTGIVPVGSTLSLSGIWFK